MDSSKLASINNALTTLDNYRTLQNSGDACRIGKSSDGHSFEVVKVTKLQIIIDYILNCFGASSQYAQFRDKTLSSRIITDLTETFAHMTGKEDAMLRLHARAGLEILQNHIKGNETKINALQTQLADRPSEKKKQSTQKKELPKETPIIIPTITPKKTSVLAPIQQNTSSININVKDPKAFKKVEAAASEAQKKLAAAMSTIENICSKSSETRLDNLSNSQKLWLLQWLAGKTFTSGSNYTNRKDVENFQFSLERAASGITLRAVDLSEKQGIFEGGSNQSHRLILLQGKDLLDFEKLLKGQESSIQTVQHNAILLAALNKKK